MIGQVILVVPVKGGHQGGRFVISSSARNYDTCIDTEDNIGRLIFSNTNFANNRIEMEPVTEGSLLTLEFKLIFSTPLPMDLPFVLLPTYLSAFSKVKESLRAWENWPKHVDQGKEGINPECSKGNYFNLILEEGRG